MPPRTLDEKSENTQFNSMFIFINIRPLNKVVCDYGTGNNKEKTYVYKNKHCCLEK